MTNELIRLLIVAEMCLLLGCGTYLHLSYRRSIPRLPWLAGLGFAWVLAAVVAAITLNLLAEEPLTLGTRLFGLLIAPAVVVIAWQSALAARTRHDVRHPHEHGVAAS